MADVVIDQAYLDTVLTDLSSMETTLSAPKQTLANLDAAIVGHDDLKAALRKFVEEWEFGIGKLAEGATAANESLKKIIESFDDADVDLAAALDEAAA